jgi:lysophospholipase L1-like esterase
MTRTRLLLLSVLALSAFATFAQGASPGAAQPFQSGDTVCWVGDSITHGGTYHAIVELFYATRFPDRSIRYYNEGIGGDRASGIMSDEPYRLNVDILAHKPTVATIMLGMNDVNRADYGPDKTGPDIEQKHQHMLDIYDENMRKLMDALTKVGARLILIQPSIFDETTTLPGAGLNTVGSNGALGKCSMNIEKWANDYHAGIVNFYGVMNEINQREQKKDPNFTLVGKDRIHPGPVGHFVMGYTFLKAQNLPREVAVISLNAKKEKAVSVVNGEIRHIRKTTDGVEFDAFEKSLPFVVPDNARGALDLVPFTKELNQEILAVSGLGKGNFTLKIDGDDAGDFSSDQLKAGVNLAEDPKTPQYRQSAAATQISAERTAVGARLRDIAAQKYGLSKAKIDVSDTVDVAKRMRDQIAAATEAGKPVNKAWNSVLEDLAEPGKLMRQYDDLSAALLKACQPREHHFVLVRATLTSLHDPPQKLRKGL